MERYDKTKKVGILGVVANLFLLIIKLVVGFISNSQAMIADAFNSAGDIFASLMTTIGNKLASVPKDDDHNLGHGKAEYIFSLLISLSMMGISLKILIESFFSILENNQLVFSYSLCGVCLITIISKLILYFYTENIYKKIPNILILSSMKDHRNDCVLTTCTLFSIICSLFGWYFVDGLVGIGISLWIFYTGFTIFVESYNVLMDISLDNKTKEGIISIINSFTDIQKVGELYSVPTGYKYIVVLTIYVDGNMSTLASHEIADCLEKRIVSDIDKIEQVIVHINPTV